MNAPVREPTGVPISSSVAVGGPDGPAQESRPKRSHLRLFLMIGGIAAVIVAAAYFWYTGDATRDRRRYVRAAEVSVSTDVSGIVTESM